MTRDEAVQIRPDQLQEIVDVVMKGMALRHGSSRKRDFEVVTLMLDALLASPAPSSPTGVENEDKDHGAALLPVDPSAAVQTEPLPVYVVEECHVPGMIFKWEVVNSETRIVICRTWHPQLAQDIAAAYETAEQWDGPQTYTEPTNLSAQDSRSQSGRLPKFGSGNQASNAEHSDATNRSAAK